MLGVFVDQEQRDALLPGLQQIQQPQEVPLGRGVESPQVQRVAQGEQGVFVEGHLADHLGEPQQCLFEASLGVVHVADLVVHPGRAVAVLLGLLVVLPCRVQVPAHVVVDVALPLVHLTEGFLEAEDSLSLGLFDPLDRLQEVLLGFQVLPAAPEAFPVTPVGVDEHEQAPLGQGLRPFEQPQRFPQGRHLPISVPDMAVETRQVVVDLRQVASRFQSLEQDVGDPVVPALVHPVPGQLGVDQGEQLGGNPPHSGPVQEGMEVLGLLQLVRPDEVAHHAQEHFVPLAVVVDDRGVLETGLLVQGGRLCRGRLARPLQVVVPPDEQRLVVPDVRLQEPAHELLGPFVPRQVVGQKPCVVQGPPAVPGKAAQQLFVLVLGQLVLPLIRKGFRVAVEPALEHPVATCLVETLVGQTEALPFDLVVPLAVQDLGLYRPVHVAVTEEPEQGEHGQAQGNHPQQGQDVLPEGVGEAPPLGLELQTGQLLEALRDPDPGARDAGHLGSHGGRSRAVHEQPDQQAQILSGQIPLADQLLDQDLEVSGQLAQSPAQAGKLPL